MTSIQIDRTDGLSSSVAIKGPCRVATTANVTLSGEQTIDGVAVVTDDRVLVKDQTAPSENGVYVVDTGAWRRAKDFSRTNDVKLGTKVFVVLGTANARSEWFTSTFTLLGDDSIVFTRSNQVSTAYMTTVNSSADDAPEALTLLGGSTIGKGIFTAVDDAAVRLLIGTAGATFVSILDFIDYAEHAAIADHTSTFDCKADIEAAITSLGAFGGTIFFPAGRYNISAKITVTGSAIYLLGAGLSFGTGGTVLRGTHATVGDILSFSASNCGGLSGFTLTCSNGVTSGIAVQLVSSCFELIIENLSIHRVYCGVDVSKATETRINQVHIREIYGTFGIRYGNASSAGCYGLTVASVTTDNPIRTAAYGTRRGNWATSTAYSLNDFVIANNHIYQCTTAGTSSGAGSGPSGLGSTPYDGTITDGTAVWKFYCSNALIWFVYDSFAYSLRLISCAFLNGAYGLIMQDTQNTGSSAPWWLHGFNLEIDHSYYFDVLLNKGEGFFITASWIGSCLTGSGITYGASWSGESVITATRIVGNWQYGVLISGGVSADISHNVIGANSQGGSGTYHGIVVSANVNEFTIVGNKIGDLHGTTEMQGYGVFVIAGTSDNYIIANNRCHNNVTGKVSDNGTGVNKSVTGNI